MAAILLEPELNPEPDVAAALDEVGRSQVVAVVLVHRR